MEPATDPVADLRRYYETEAELRRRRGPVRRGLRREVRAEFLDLLAAERRHSVLELGAGPGRDGEAFAAAGHHHVGLDLAHGNGRLAAEVGLTVVQASITAAPVRPGSFDAGWSMSTLMHLPPFDAGVALGELVGALRPGSPAVLGQWGREQEEEAVVADDDVPRPGPAVLPPQLRPQP